MAHNPLALSRRFMALDAEKRRVFLNRLREQGMGLAALPIPSGIAGDDSPASYAQQRLWLIDRLEPGNSAYHLTGTLRLKGSPDIQALQQAFASLAARHDSLRTRFAADAEGQPRQQVLKPEAMVGVDRIERLNPPAGLSWQSCARDFAQRAFNLNQGPLWRVGLIPLSENDQVLVLCLHHIITDGWSIQILLSELAACYQAALAGEAPALEPLALQYPDYALWQRHTLEAGAGDEDLAYWCEQLGGELPVLELPMDYPRPAQRTFRGQRHDFQLPEATASQLRQLARKQGTTLFNVLLAGYAVLLHRLSGQTEVCVGTPIAGRERAELEDLVGLFVNTQVMRLPLGTGLSLQDFLTTVGRTTREAQAHQGLPFERLVHAVQPDRSLSHNPLFQVLYNHQQQGSQVFELARGLTAELQPQDSAGAQVDLSLHTWETEDGALSGTWSFATDLFNPRTIERFHHQYQQILAQLVAQPEQSIGDFDLLDDTDRTNLQTWNTTAADYGQPEPVHRLFERQAAAHPDREAVVFGDQRLSYSELDTAANRLAHHLIGQGVSVGSLVGVATERSIEMVVALYAIQKAGAAYVPIDPDHPQARQQQVLTDAGVDLLLTHNAVVGGLPELGDLPVVNLDALDLSELHSTVPDIVFHPEQRSYVIYTSGSTGKPKGVANTHAALYNRLQWMQAAYELGEDDTVLQKTPYSFDVSVWEFFWPLMVGARLVVAQPGDHKDPATLAFLIAKERVTTIHFVPSMLSAFMAQEELSVCASLKRIVCSGEALPKDLQDQALSRLPEASLYNLYGPTEAAIDVTHWTCSEDDRTTVPIGKPIGNLQIHILDSRLNEQPIGVPGELYIGGKGLAQGYHGRPDLTAERFVPSPFSRGERLYRSGDLARWCRDGTLEYLGRLDHQIKLRGLRIELGEIEAVMRGHEGVQDAVVIARNDQLIGYVQGTAIDTESLTAALKRQLPDYMVPVHLVSLDDFPLSANGKLDRKALPDPEVKTVDYEAPQGEIETVLAGFWQELLRADRVGRHDNFFALGGDSILSLRIIAKAKAEGIELTPRDLFEQQTIAELAQAARFTEIGDVPQIDVDRAFPLTPIQQWFFDQSMPTPSHWNQALLLEPQEPLQTEALSKALAALVDHHDALRLSFSGDGAKVHQRYLAEGSDGDLLWYRACSDEALVNVCDEAQASLDIKGGRLLRAVQIRLDSGAERLLLVIHHLAVDGVSWRILLDDLVSAYQQAQAGQQVGLGAKGFPFQAWADRMAEWKRTGVAPEERQYWMAIPQPGCPPQTRTEGDNLVRHLRRQSARLDDGQTRELLESSSAAFRTRIHELLLTALGQALHEWTGQGEHTIALEGHGREDLFGGCDLSRTVGWFTSLYPVRLPGAGNLLDNLKATKERLRSVPNGGLGFGVLRHMEGDLTLPDLSSAILFNYLGQVGAEGEQGMSLAKEFAGNTRAADAPLGFEILLDGQVRDGQLEFVCSYSGERHTDDAMQRLMSLFRASVEQVLSICRSQAGLTPSDFPLATVSQQALDTLPLPAKDVDDLLPLTPMQSGLLFHSELGGEGDLYVNQLSVTVDNLPVDAFRAAWADAFRRHPVLRAGFVQLRESPEPLQVIHHDAGFEICELDWREAPGSFEALCDDERVRPFDLTRPPLMRLVLVRRGEHCWQMVWTVHHILLDGWSSASLLSEIMGQALGAGAPRSPDSQAYYHWLANRDAQGSDNFWQSQVGALIEPTCLAPVLGPVDEGGEATGHGEFSVVLNRRPLDAFTREHQVTLNTLVQGVWTRVLQGYTGNEQVCFGATVSGRPADVPQIERQLGLFINTLPVIQSPAGDLEVGSWLADLQAHNLALREHEHVPLYRIQQLGGRPGQALFDTLLVFENFPVDEALRQGQDSVRFQDVQVSERTHYPLTVAVDVGQDLTLRFQYRKGLVSEARVLALSEHLSQLLDTMTRNPRARLGTLPLTTPDETDLLRVWNDTSTDYGQPELAHRLFERQAAAHPDREALVFGDKRLSYGELDAAANRLAHHLIAQGVSVGSLVGVATERSIEMVVALYAIQKAGAAYVPIDPDHPEARQKQVLDGAGVDVLLTHSPVIHGLPNVEGLRILELNALDLSDQQTTAPTLEIHPEQRAYVIYTSGSTGKPKGVANTHAALYNRLQWMQAAYDLGENDTVLQKTPYSFDVSVWEFFWPLMTGARLVVAQPGDHKDPAKLASLIAKERVTTIHFVPSMLSAFMAQEDLSSCASLKRIVCSGEALPKDLQDQALARLPQANLYNLYGPTEAAIDVTHWSCGEDERTRVPIGQPIGNLQIHILDSRLNEQPIGVPGELYIGGAGLAREYHGRPDLTAERFVPSPFKRGERLYRSGDLARWCSDGTIEYLGRLDHQIKLRGLRIELGEIEAVMRGHEGVQDAVVIARNDQLIGYVQGTAIDTESLVAELKRQLPDYMVPVHLLTLDTFPLSANGKLDRKALPDPDVKTVEYEAPQGEIETALAGLWQALLGVDRVGRDDNFFALGGHSLLAVRLVHRIRWELGQTLPLNHLFETRTLAELAEVLDRQEGVGMPPLVPRNAGSQVPQSYAQQRLWFLAQLEPDSSAYHLPGGLCLEGELNEAALERAFISLAYRHESLRTRFVQGDDAEPLQVVSDTPTLAFEQHDLRSAKGRKDALRSIVATFNHRSFDLEQAPPWRVALVRIDDYQWHLLLCMHHIVSDGWSIQVLLDELVAIYRAESLGCADGLAPLAVQYPDYSLWQQENLAGPELARQLDWWRSQLGDEHPTLDLPMDRPRPSRRDGQGGRYEFLVPSDVLARLRQVASTSETSLFTVILTAFESWLYRLSGQRDLRIGIPVSGRHQPGTEGLIGFFVNTLVLRADIAPGDRASDLLAQVRERMQGAQAHADLPFEQLVEALDPERSLSHNPLFQVSYNHQVVNHRSLDEVAGLRCAPLPSSADTAHFDLVLGTQEFEDGRVTACLTYATDILDSDTVSIMSRQLLLVLDAVSRNPDTLLAMLPLLSDVERQQWTRWNRPAHPPVDPRPISALIADQARAHPNAVAVVHGSDRLTFAEFDTRANRLSHWLIRQGVGAESRVGVALERGANMLVALYAVHKAGAAYVPLDPDYPAERVRYMLEDSGADLLLSHDAALDRLPDIDGVQTVNLDELDVSGEPSSVPELSIHPDQLAYLIYTSGSTGKPKGVAVTHGGISMHCQTIGARYEMTPADRELHFLSISFDGAHERWLTVLGHGARLVLRDQQLWSVQQTFDCLMDEGITVAAFPPSYLRQLAEWAELKGQSPNLRVICFAGEAFSRQMMHHAIEHLKPQFIINGYGPTETVVTPTLWKVSGKEADFDSAYAPIGDLVGDRQGYVLDNDLNLLPPGVAGELYLGGALARGYLDRPGTTAERFVPNPFRASERLYRTGDRVRLNNDGQLEYLGRLDQQIKLRGYRIEIGEVEAALKTCEGVKDTLAVVKETAAGPKLVGYVSGEELDEHAIKATLKERLPEYMVPTHIVALERLPQLPNGKLDRNALPEPVSATANYEAPATPHERQLALLWQELLQQPRIGRNDHFFELGGHSLLATQLVSRIRHEQGLELPLRAMFEMPVLADLAAWCEDLEPSADKAMMPRLGLNQAPQSFAQQRLWFLAQLDPGSAAYNLPGALSLKGDLNDAALQQAFDVLTGRHEVLRTRLVAADGNESIPQQVIDAPSPVRIKRLDLRASDDAEVDYEAIAKEVVSQPFDLSTSWLWRVTLVRMSSDEWRLLICMHHGISDGWSVPILLAEFAEAYRAICGQERAELEPLPVQYADFAVWQRNWLASGEGERQLDYWRDQLGGEQTVIELPTDRPRPAKQSFRGARYPFSLSPALSQQLQVLASARGVTPFMLLLTAYNVLLHRLSGQADVRVGVPMAGRNRQETEGLIGFFVNTQVLRSDVAPELSFDALLDQVKSTSIAAQAHQDLPFEQLVEAFQPDRNLSHNPLFQVAYDHQRSQLEALGGLPGLEVSAMAADDNSTQFDLSLNTREDASGAYSGDWNYATDLFDAPTIIHLHQRFERLLGQIVLAPEQAIGDFDLLDDADRTSLQTWNDTAADYGQPEPVHRLFERQAAAHPDREALVVGDKRLSYSELDAAANRLAHHLIGQGVSVGSLVGVATERSIEMVVALYAIQKAGAAYVPIDPDHPEARQKQVLDGAGVDVLLAHSPVVDGLPNVEGLRILELNALDLSDQQTTAPTLEIHPEQRAYVIYTSGSTGKPKGVANTHAALYNRLQWMQAAYDLGENDTVLQKTPYSFDVSVWEFFWPLMTGARLVVAQPGDHKDPAKLSEIIQRESVTTIHFVPSMLSAFMAQENLSGCLSLKRVICSGEALPKDLQDQAITRLPEARLYNLYGPTEAAIDVTHWTCGEDDRTTVPIGKPIGNLQIHILDSRLNEQPIGVPGELYIGGAGLAREYHGRPDLTAERFIPSPFGKGERLYRSGDLARWCSDGTIEYLGRLDHQIKLRGLRIELGEIEAVMRGHEGVQDAVVIARNDQLTGYVQGTAIDTDALTAELKRQLPDYMVPVHLMVLDSFPLSANGKLDRKALPDPDLKTEAYEAPIGETEQTLARLWQELLGVERVGRHDNFFALGGHSLMGVNLVHRVQKELQRSLPLSQVFETRSLQELAGSVDASKACTLALQPYVRGEETTQSFSQQRLWFLAQLDPDSRAYHLPGGLRLAGDLDESALARAFTALTWRHETLRTRFRHGDDGQPKQCVLSGPAVSLEHRDLRDPGSATTDRVFRSFCLRPFDLEAAPPWRIALVHTQEREWHLLLCMHHILSDGWSMQLLLEELVQLYWAEVSGQPAMLEPLVIQYADYALWQQEHLSGNEQARQLDWWRSQLGADHPTLDLPTDRPRPAQRDGRGARFAFTFPPALTRALRDVASSQQTTLFNLVLAGFQAWLHRLSGQRDVRVGVPVSGRHQPGTEGLIGFFVNTLVLRAEIAPGDRASDLLTQVRDRMQGAQSHADLPFEQLVEALDPERSLSHNPLFQVSYNHQVFDQRPLANLDGLTCAPLTGPAENAHFDLVLGTQEQADGHLSAYLDYATDILDSNTVARMADQIQRVLAEICERPDQRLSDLSLLSPADEGIWSDWNHPSHGVVDPRPICALIANQARMRPDAIAVVHGDSRLTFHEFDTRANRLAHWLMRQGVGAESRVGVALERGVDMLVALYAVHTSGAAYVPLDPDYPAERVRYMLEDSGADLLLSHEAALDRLPEIEGVQTVNLDELDVSGEPAMAPNVSIHPDQLAYLIYTSGSTGKPKGVAVTHGGISMHCQTIGARYEMTPEDRELHFLSISFDGAHERWLTVLGHGARLVLRDQQLWSVQQTFDCLMDEGITVAAFPPSYLRQLAEWAELKGQSPNLRVICFAGEAFSRQMMHHVIEHLKPAYIINGYGPTETVVTPTLWKVSGETADFDSAYAPIGDLVGARQGYVLDNDLNLLPPGVAGELYLGGALARGYLDRPGTTAERFVPSPFRRGERLYRTGDRVKLNNDGQLEYLGRVDQQIKLRGYRIEIGEVEAALKACEGVKDTLAVVKETVTGPKLVGYVSGEELDEHAIKAALKERLPEYMVPTHIVTLERLPQLPNGKLDRNALPEPMTRTLFRETPRGEREERLAALWCDVLGVDEVSREDSFFELGGDSIQSLGLITRLRQAGWHLVPRTVFLRPHLADMAEALEPATVPVAVPRSAAGVLPLTPIQSHFFEQPMADRSHWNQSLLLRVKRPLGGERLKQAVQAVLDHHDALRLGFHQQADNQWQAFYRNGESANRVFREIQLPDSAQVTAICEQSQRGFDLTEGPLASVLLIHLPGNEQRLLLSFHHLVVDGVSWRILMNDLADAYQQLEDGREPELLPVGASYQQWARYLSESVTKGLWQNEKGYWEEQLKQDERWPVEDPQGASRYGDVQSRRWCLDEPSTRRLLRETLSAHDAEIEDLLLAALAEGLRNWGGLESPLVAVEGHGREPGNSDLDLTRTLGWFTSLYPVRLASTGIPQQTLPLIKRQRRAIPGKGLGYGVLRYLAEPDTRSRLADHREAPLVFNYLGQFDGAVGDDRFEPAPESPGALVDPGTPMTREMEINGEIRRGQLVLTCRYGRHRYRTATVDHLLDSVGKALQSLLVIRDDEAPSQAGSTLDPLVHLVKGQTDSPTLFCPHPVSGTVVGYYPLAGRLAPHWVVEGLQNRQILDARWRDESLSAMARDYVRSVLATQPQGPYHLLGWSMGGTLALEMAAVLERLGKTVAFVGLIDGYIPGAGHPREGAFEAALPEGVAADQWQQLLVLERHMRHLAQGHDRIRPVKAPVHAWWAEKAPENNEGAERLFAEQAGRPVTSSVWLPEDHLSIVRSPQFIDRLATAMGQLERKEARPGTLETGRV